jgi:RloB-like protein
MPPSRSPAPPSLGRRSAFIPLAPRVLIVCEGRTEHDCLTRLRQHWRVPSAQVECVAEAGVPKTVVQTAKRIAKESRPETVVVVFDRDEHPSWADALQMANANRFRCATSNPCVELWGILLHEDHSAPISRHEAQRKLARLHPGYDHAKNPYLNHGLVLAGMDEAELRAARLDKRAASAANERGNPTTSFALAIASIQEARGSAPRSAAAAR